MYERSAIVLERYLSKIFGQDKITSVKSSYDTYTDILEELDKYQIITEEEEKIIEEFDAIAQEMQAIQRKQEKLFLDSIEQEEERNKLFNDFEQEPDVIEKKLLKMEKILEENAEEQKKYREEYIKLLKEFTEKQKERNQCSKTKRTVETGHMKSLNETIDRIEAIDKENIKKVKEFITLDNQTICQALNKVMLENGKNEKVKFDTNVIKKAVETRIEIAKKEAECYINIYDKLRRLMSEIEGESVKLAKYQKVQRDTTIKFNFLNAEKEYIVSFLDNERMTAINGEKMHKQAMQQACKNYDTDIKQINNLYNLILREIANKATKKAYRELYNSTYLLDIEQAEKNFNQEVNNISTSVATVINTNYWRIEGIKNLYEVFNEEVTEKFERDLSEFMPEEEKEEEIDELEETIEQTIEEDYQKEDMGEEEEWFISSDEIEQGRNEGEILFDDEEEKEEPSSNKIFGEKEEDINDEKIFGDEKIFEDEEEDLEDEEIFEDEEEYFEDEEIFEDEEEYFEDEEIFEDEEEDFEDDEIFGDEEDFEDEETFEDEEDFEDEEILEDEKEDFYGEKIFEDEEDFESDEDSDSENDDNYVSKRTRRIQETERLLKANKKQGKRVKKEGKRLKEEGRRGRHKNYSNDDKEDKGIFSKIFK